MQIVHGGKVSRLHDLVICGKTFTIVQQFETPYNLIIRQKKFAGKPLRLEANLQNALEANLRFPPRTICIIRYKVNTSIQFRAYNYWYKIVCVNS